MAEKGVQQAPERVAGKADRDENQQHLPERLVRERLQSATLIRRLSAGTERELDRQDPDDPVDDTSRDEAGSCEHLECGGALDPVCSRLRAAHRHRPRGRANAHLEVQRTSAPRGFSVLTPEGRTL